MYDAPTSVFQGLEKGEELDHFHQRCIIPTVEEITSFSGEVDAFVQHLQKELSTARPYTVSKVLKAGSLGKYTCIRGALDVELVLFLNGLSSVLDLVKAREPVLDRVHMAIRSYKPWRGRVRRKLRTSFFLSIVLDGVHTIDFLPAFDVVNHTKTREGLLAELQATSEIKSTDFIAQQFSASLAPLQVDFVKRAGEPVKKVIRLLKQWKRERLLHDLTAYTLELVVIHCAGEEFRGTTSDLFVKVLMTLRHHALLRLGLNLHYNCNDFLQLHEVPFVLDVANPYNNLIFRADLKPTSDHASATLRLKIC